MRIHGKMVWTMAKWFEHVPPKPVGWIRFRPGYTEDLKNVFTGCPTSCSMLMGGCKVYSRCCHPLATNPAFTTELATLPLAQSKRRRVPQTTRDQKWPESHFQTPTPLLFQNLWIRIRVQKFSKFENPTPVETPATIDATENQQCRVLSPAPGPKRKTQNPSGVDSGTLDPRPPLLVIHGR